MADTSFRTERDSMGEVRVPKGAYYGAQTQRAIGNFPISGIGFPAPFIGALGMIQSAAASANEQLGLLARLAAGSGGVGDRSGAGYRLRQRRQTRSGSFGNRTNHSPGRAK